MLNLFYLYVIFETLISCNLSHKYFILIHYCLVLFWFFNLYSIYYYIIRYVFDLLFIYLFCILWMFYSILCCIVLFLPECVSISLIQVSLGQSITSKQIRSDSLFVQKAKYKRALKADLRKIITLKINHERSEREPM